MIVRMNIILFRTMPECCTITRKEHAEVYNHITRVLKLEPGDSFRMGIVNINEGNALVKNMNGEGIEFEYTPLYVPRLYPVTLLVAQVRPICMKRILREAVSLGVCRIILCGSDTGEKSYLSSNLYKTGEYEWYLLEGAMQGAGAGVPSVAFAKDVNQALEICKPACGKASLYLADNAGSCVPLSGCTPLSEAVLAVGPERGWSDRERKAFADNGFESVLLGGRVLRTETACSAGLAVLLSRMNLL